MREMALSGRFAYPSIAAGGLSPVDVGHDRDNSEHPHLFAAIPKGTPEVTMSPFSLLCLTPCAITLSAFCGAQILTDPSNEYSIRSAETGKVMDVRDGSMVNGALIQQWDWLGGANQRWRIVPLDGADQGYYSIVAVHSAKVLDVSSASQDNGAGVAQFEWLGGDNQKWKLIDCGNGCVLIQAKHSGKMLGIAGKSHDNAAVLQQWGYLAEGKAGGPKKPDIAGRSHDKASIPKKWDHDLLAYQKWRLQVECAVVTSTSSHSESIALLPDGAVQTHGTVRSGPQDEHLGVGEWINDGSQSSDTVAVVRWTKRDLPEDQAMIAWLGRHQQELLEILKLRVSEDQLNAYLDNAERGKSLDEVIEMRTELILRILSP